MLKCLTTDHIHHTRPSQWSAIVVFRPSLSYSALLGSAPPPLQSSTGFFFLLSSTVVACVTEEGCRASSLRDWRSTGALRGMRELKVPLVPLASHFSHVPSSVQRVYLGTRALEGTVFYGLPWL